MSRLPIVELLLALPLLLLLEPSATLLGGDPFPLDTATGWVFLLTLPAFGAALLKRRIRPHLTSVLLLVPALWFLSSMGTDSFARSRALVALGISVLTFVASASWPSERPRPFATVLVCTTLLALVPALWAGFEGDANAYAGALGNSGWVSQVALPGAVMGAAFVQGQSGWKRILGGLACVTFAAHSFFAPVLAGGVALLAGLVVLALRSWLQVETSRAPLALRIGVAALLVAGPAAAMLYFLPTQNEAPSALTSAAPTDSQLGGLAVRANLATRLPALLAEHPFGLGPGQFQAGFPPFRDEAEIELSTFGRRIAESTEVEHLHNDWLQGFADWGIVGGLSWVVFLVLVLWRALWSAGSPVQRGWNAAAVALLINAWAHSNLLANPVSGLAAFAVFGALWRGSDSTDEPSKWSLRDAAIVAVLAGLAFPAWRLAAHGSELKTRIDLADSKGAGHPDVRAHLDAALELFPESPVLLADRARVHTALGEHEAAGAAWSAFLATRPNNIEALAQFGLTTLMAGRPGAARETWERVLELDPGHPTTHRNLARLELAELQPTAALTHFDALSTRGQLDAQLLVDLVTREFLQGRLNSGKLVWERMYGEPIRMSGDELTDRSEAAAEEGHAQLADALRCAAQQVFGRDHFAQGRFGRAIVSLRQALTLSRKHDPAGIGAPLLRMELGAAFVRADRATEARETLAGLPAASVAEEGLAPGMLDAIHELNAFE